MFLPRFEVYFAFFASGLPAFLEAGWPPPAGLATASGLAAGPPAIAAGPFLRRSAKSCQNNTIGLAMKTEE